MGLECCITEHQQAVQHSVCEEPSFRNESTGKDILCFLTYIGADNSDLMITLPSPQRYSPGEPWPPQQSVSISLYLSSSPFTALSLLLSGLLQHHSSISNEVLLFFFLQTVFIPSPFLASLPFPFSLRVPAILFFEVLQISQYPPRLLCIWRN